MRHIKVEICTLTNMVSLGILGNLKKKLMGLDVTFWDMKLSILLQTASSCNTSFIK